MDGENLCFCLPSFAGGGAEKVFITLINHLVAQKKKNKSQDLCTSLSSEAKYAVKSKNSLDMDLLPTPSQTSCVVLTADGPLRSSVPSNCVIHDMKCGSAKLCFFRLIKHFKETKPSIVIST